MLPQLACPRCRTSFQANAKASPGGGVACPRCGAACSSVPVAAPFAPPPVVRRPSAPATPRSSALVLAGLAGAALLLVGTGIALAYLCFSEERPRRPAVVRADRSLPRTTQPETISAKPAEAPPPAAKPAVEVKEPAPAPEVPMPPPAPPKKAPAVESDERPPELVIRKTQTVPGWSGSLTPELQKKVNEAIDRGVAYLRANQLRGGSWEDGRYLVGYAALPGLTLLECGVPADDPAVRKAAHQVRFHRATLNHTYQIALSILFLDRLGDPKDRKLIQSLALRLVAGQNSAGGWTYTCPILKVPEERKLLIYLREHQPRHLREAIAHGKKRSLPDLLEDPHRKTPLDPITDPKRKGDLSEGITDPRKAKGTLPEAIEAPGKVKSAPQTAPPGTSSLADPAPSPAKPAPSAAKPKPAPAVPPKAERDDAPKMPKMKVPPRVTAKGPDFLPPNLRNLPALQKGQRGNFKGRLRPAIDDNSNTQFAMMALWAARRHDVPMHQSLALVEERFRVSQKPEGGWSYMFQVGPPTGSMTCVGLIALAVGHGAAREMLEPGKAPGRVAQDEAISRGLSALGGFLDNPDPGRRRFPGLMVGTYFLWSVERVGVLYGLRTVGNKDWYRWGVDILLPNQKDDGSWFSNGYPGSSATLDTCMALLFLKRANLTQDLTTNLRLYMAITDPEVANPGAKR